METNKRDFSGWTEGMTVYVRWNDSIRQGTLSRLRHADDGSQDLSVPPGTVRVYFVGNGCSNVEWSRVWSSLELASSGFDSQTRRIGGGGSGESTSVRHAS